MTSLKSSYVQVDGIRTHYLEAGEGPALVLLHSGEFGACAELSWERNIAALSGRFHVYAPDWLGYGKTEKLFSFDNMRARRETHIAAFLQAIGIARAHFIANSMGGTMLLAAAASDPAPWPMDRIIVVAGGGDIPDNAARAILNSYDCTLGHMRKIVETMFVDPAIRHDEAYIERRYRLSIEPGAWECTAAARFKAPHRAAPTSGVRPLVQTYDQVRVPVLLVTGADDPLRPPDFGPQLQRRVPGAELFVIPDAGHCPHIEHPDLFNARAIAFLEGHDEAGPASVEPSR